MKLKLAKKYALVAAALAALFVMPAAALADVAAEAQDAAAFDAFDEIWWTIVALMQGTFGRIIALLVIIAGVIAGIRTGNMIAFLSGAGVGVLMFFAPTILEALQGQVIAPELMIEMMNNPG